MQSIIFCGIQGSGKSTFYKERFFDTHLRINLDQLRTRNREKLLLDVCLRTQMRFVVDNTNSTILERSRYIELARAAKYEIIGYFFESSTAAALARNNRRIGRFKVPEKGIFGTQKHLQVPTMKEGYDQLYRVQLLPSGSYEVHPVEEMPLD
ncbi:AAA family ATPase [Pontibacter sp. H249]|uniref:AAA family ATPase n=1 Tax=Pontibacter sp. H249 TaxID=3133420 RepID=UPI0030BEBA70